MNGTVKWFDDNKGYGFILKEGAAPGDPCSEFFVHHEAILCAGRRTLNEGDAVSFDESQRGGKLRAANVKLTGRAPQAQNPPEPKSITSLEIIVQAVDEWERATGNHRETHLVHDFIFWFRTEGSV